MKLTDKLVVGAAMVGQLACGASQQVAEERRGIDEIEASSSVGRRAPEKDLEPAELATEITSAAALAAAAVEKCLQVNGGRIALEVSDTEAYVAESVRPTASKAEVGMRVGQYFMCNDANQKCGVGYAIPNQFSDSFGSKFERWGLEAWRFHDVSAYTGKMNGADGQADRIFDFNLPPRGGHEAVCIPMPDRGAAAFADHRPSNNAVREHTDIVGCRPPSTPKMTRAYFQDQYRQIIAKLAQSCASGKVHVPGEKYVKPEMSSHGIGSIDTGGVTERR